MTGSVVVPLKAALMNVVSIGATFGVLDAVFEHGFAAGLLHTTTVSGISPFVIVTVFAFAFGLSMDYEVFLLARIKEQVDRGVPTDVAVRRGLQRSGRIITSAALLMVVVFGCFVIGRIGNVQQIGLGLAVAVAIDATLVRCVLVPATMTLLGRVELVVAAVPDAAAPGPGLRSPRGVAAGPSRGDAGARAHPIAPTDLVAHRGRTPAEATVSGKVRAVLRHVAATHRDDRGGECRHHAAHSSTSALWPMWIDHGFGERSGVRRSSSSCSARRRRNWRAGTAAAVRRAATT